MSLFKNLTTDGLEESQDRLGGYSPLETGVYTGKIKAFYAGTSAKGAHNVTVEVGFDNGTSYRETVYVTNRGGDNFYISKNEPNKKNPLPGFTTIDDIALCTVGKNLADLDFTDKVINVYDVDAKKEVPKSVPMAMELLGQEVTLAIYRNIEDKTKEVNGEYVPTGESHMVNVINKVFNTETGMTVHEARHGASEAKFQSGWVERNAGKDRDKRAGNDNSGAAGRPGVPSQAPGAAAGGAPRKSLFGK